MAISGFMPAWMKIQSSDESNRNEKLNIDRSNTGNHSQNRINSTILKGQYRHKSNDQQSSANLDEQSENCFSFQLRRSYSKECLSNSYGKPSLNGLNLSSNDNEHSSIWNNAAFRFRNSSNGRFSRKFRSNHLLTHKNRLLSTPNNISIRTQPSMMYDLQTNCMTQTRNLDKRSNFLNSLKNESNNEERNAIKRHYSESSKAITNSDENMKSTKKTLLSLSLFETSEEKELLMRMGWNDNMTYEITDKDKEEYEKRMKHFPKTNNRYTALKTALHRHSLPCINIQDVLRLDIVDSPSDDDSSDD